MSDYSNNLKELRRYITKDFNSADSSSEMFNYINQDGTVKYDSNLDGTNITEANIMKSYILNTNKYKKPSTTNPYYKCFTEDNPPYAIYFAEDYIQGQTAGSGSIPNATGVARNATVFGVPTLNKNNRTLTGGTTSGINFPDLPNLQQSSSSFTIASITKYNSDSNQNLVLQSGPTWYHGHNNGTVKACSYSTTGTNYIKVASPSTSNKDWVILTGTNDTSHNTVYSATSSTTSTNVGALGALGGDKWNGLSINKVGNNLNINNSEWGFSCLMIWNKILSDDDIQIVNTFLYNYINANENRELLKSPTRLCVETNKDFFNMKTSNNELILTDKMYKYYFLLEVLTGIYENIYKFQKSKNIYNPAPMNINDLLEQGFTISTDILAKYDEATSVQSFKRRQEDVSTPLFITTNNLSNINNIEDNFINNITPNNDANNKGYLILFRLIETDFIKHINFIKKFDVYQSINFYKFYKNCLNIFRYNLIINKEIYNNSNPPYSSINLNNDATYTNFISKIESELSNTFPAELPDQSMEIYDTMDEIQSTNSSLRTVKSKISLKINEYKHFKENVLNDSIYLEIFSIVILVISGLLTILVIISNDKQVYLLYNMVFLMIVGMLFFIIYYYFYIYKNIQEYFDTANSNNDIIDYFNTKFANIMFDLNNTNVKVVNNIINEKSKNELDKYNRIYNKYNIYQNKVNNDLLLESLENKKRAINIFIILSFATFLILFNIAIIYNNIIIAGILIFFKIFLMMLYYYYDRSKFVNTSRNKYYWKQPENKF
jgi:hypothetical protein